jgi:hypothetical protein
VQACFACILSSQPAWLCAPRLGGLRRPPRAAPQRWSCPTPVLRSSRAHRLAQTGGGRQTPSCSPCHPCTRQPSFLYRLWLDEPRSRIAVQRHPRSLPEESAIMAMPGRPSLQYERCTCTRTADGHRPGVGSPALWGSLRLIGKLLPPNGRFHHHPADRLHHHRHPINKSRGRGHARLGVPGAPAGKCTVREYRATTRYTFRRENSDLES